MHNVCANPIVFQKLKFELFITNKRSKKKIEFATGCVSKLNYFFNTYISLLKKIKKCFFIGIHRLGLKVDNRTKSVATSVERGPRIECWYEHRLVQALVSWNRPHRNDSRKYEPSHECMHGKDLSLIYSHWYSSKNLKLWVIYVHGTLPNNRGIYQVTIISKPSTPPHLNPLY